MPASECKNIADTWPSGFARGTVTPSQVTCTWRSSFTCSLGTIAAGSNATFTVNFPLPPSSTLFPYTTLFRSSTTSDPNATNNSASDTDAVTTSADLSVVKTDSADPAL